MKKYFIVCLVLCSLMSQLLHAEEKEYILAEVGIDGYQVIDTFSTYYRANRAFHQQKEEYNNLVISYDNKVLKMERGIVEFRVDQGCTLSLSYRRENGNQGNINGCYGIDGLYIESDGNEVDFMIAGDKGTIALDDVTLHPYEMLSSRISAYSVKEGVLYHHIKSQLKNDFYFATVALGDAPSYLRENQVYYSYDGHYFFDSFAKLSDAVKKQDVTLSVNGENPYYAYFQYLSNRSLSHYNSEDVKSYFQDNLAYHSRMSFFVDNNHDNVSDILNHSQYVGQIENFFAYQYQYGANALMMLSLSMEESGNGKSFAAYKRNSLFGRAAYDSLEERNSSRYASIQNSIRSHAKYYVSRSYSSLKSPSYAGSFFGDKRSGMNVHYADDPYWGEKVAQHYYRLDKELGQKDYGSMAIGITTENRIRIYRDAAAEDLLYTIRDISPLSFVLLAKEGDYYKVQLENSTEDDYRYDFETRIGYIAQEDFSKILFEENIQERQFFNIEFDGNGGFFDGQEILSIKVPKGQIPSITVPVKEGFVFDGFDRSVVFSDKEERYIAQFRKVEKIAIESFPNTLEQADALDLRHARLRVQYQNDTQLIPINSDMIDAYDSSLLGKQKIIVRYAGLQAETEITITQTMTQAREELEIKKKELFTKIEKHQDISLEELLKFKEELIEANVRLSIEETTILDSAIYQHTKDKVLYVIEDEEQLDLAVSGLNVALNISEKDFDKPILPTIFGVKSIPISRQQNYILTSMADAYHYQGVKGFGLQLFKDNHFLEASLPLVVRIRAQETDRIYTVYYLDDNGDIYQCASVRSENYIRFLAPGSGAYLLVEQETNNRYNLRDQSETLEEKNTDRYVYSRFFRRICIAMFAIFSLLMIVFKKKLQENYDLSVFYLKKEFLEIKEKLE